MEKVIFVILIVAGIIGFLFVLNSLRQIRESEENVEREEKTREEAKKNAAEEENNRRKHAKAKIWWTEFFIIIAIITMAINIAIKKFFTINNSLLICVTITIAIDFLILLWAYKSTPEKEHWTIELLGHWFVTWHPGPHFLLPFIMNISGKVYMGDRMCTLYMDDKERNGEKDAVIEFVDASAGVIARLYYRFFSAHRAIYNIDNVQSATREKMDAGLRAYLGKQKLDEALKTRASLSLKSILKEEATEAAIFKFWGTEIRTLALTDVILPPGIIKTREQIITATKERDVAEISVETARQKAKAEQIIQRVAGTAIGEKIQQVMKKTKLSKEQTVSYLLTEDGLKAIKDNKGIFMGLNNGSASIGAEFAAGFTAVSDSLKNTASSSIKETDEEPKKEGKKVKEEKKGGERQ